MTTEQTQTQTQILPLSDAIVVSQARNKQNFEAKYFMVSPQERRKIIYNIDSGKFDTQVETGRKAKWWLKKHYPKEVIPTNIYLLGGGLTLKELHALYNCEYVSSPPMEWHDFRNYTRELIAQGIMYNI